MMKEIILDIKKFLLFMPLVVHEWVPLFFFKLFFGRNHNQFLSPAIFIIMLMSCSLSEQSLLLVCHKVMKCAMPFMVQISDATKENNIIIDLLYSYKQNRAFAFAFARARARALAFAPAFTIAFALSLHFILISSHLISYPFAFAFIFIHFHIK